ncbi:myristylated tegument protein CIRC [Cervid alphaherpesvirus 1]|uniref:Myristylated tegument protein CIRC n=1 Tax=Cervid alphaherpesvirus 1 TaxID=79891 RepID=A0A455JN36_9ALPH|nr:myristylated tegument protein CIRC [Cervid alphaherpesvirus 1]AVT50654.1 myristylated tegument protein CIRC [Cervid alphaherpesvirus 1]
MGAGASASAAAPPPDDSAVLLAALSGRTIDLPGGDEAVFVSRPTTHPMYHHMRRDRTAHTTPMHFVGRAYAILPCRKFMLYLMRSGAIYGYEPATGLHRLADSLHELLTVAGLQQRDLHCLDVTVLDAQMDPVTFTTPEILIELEADPAFPPPPSARARRSTLRRTSMRPPARAPARAFCPHQLAEGSILDLCSPEQAAAPGCSLLPARGAPGGAARRGSVGEGAYECGPASPDLDPASAPDAPSRHGSVRSVFF